MKLLRISLITLILVLTMAAVPRVLGQGLVDVYGTLVPAPGAASDQYTIVITDRTRHEHNARVDPGGEFFLSRVSQGQGELRVLDSRGGVIHQETVSLWDDQSTLQVRLSRPEGSPVPADPGPISLTRLMHKPAKAAVKEFRKAQSAAQKGDLEAAFTHYQRAVTLDADWYEALVNLGAQCYKTERMPEAVAYLRRAVEIDPDGVQARINLGAALAAVQEFQESEQVTRRVLKLSPGNAKAHYVLGFTLAMQGDTCGAMEELRQAAEFPAARQLLQQLAGEAVIQ